MDPVSTSAEFAALERRVNAISARNRVVWILAAGALLAGLVAGADDDSSEKDTIQGRRIQLVDGAGRVRAELAIDQDGSAGLFVRDQSNRVRASLTHDDAQSALYIWDEDGQVRVGAAQFAHGGGGVALHGPHGKGGTALYHKGTGSLTFYDKDGGVTARVPTIDE